MAAQTWDSLKTMLLATLVNAQPPYTAGTAGFDVLFPQATSYAEGRICRDIVFLANRAVNTSLVTIAGSRVVDLSSLAPALIAPEGFALVTPAGTTNPALGTRVPFDLTSLDVIDEIWPIEAQTRPPSITDWSPRYWALGPDQQTIVCCPTPDQVYTVALTGLFPPTPISETNQSTYLSETYPELLEAACMVFLSGALQHNFSAKSDNPEMAISWATEYRILMESAKMEELRRRGLLANVATPAARG